MSSLFYIIHTFLCSKEKFYKAHFENRLPDRFKSLARYRMLIIDETGYLPKEKAEMMDLFTTKHNTGKILGLTREVKRREQRHEEWYKLITDKILS